MSLNDPIIDKLLSKRSLMTDVSLQAEQERQRRMYVMLRHSKKYKKLQVEEANKLWGEDLDTALSQLSSGIQTVAPAESPHSQHAAETVHTRRRSASVNRVSFCEKTESIPMMQIPSALSSITSLNSSSQQSSQQSSADSSIESLN